ncbi:hypothetical protein VCR12J2_1380182 [Vibrio coralliirubri]|nr:hypothetical protein VCR12J2_1380182 [Vibrio coralliirubri]
MNLIENLALWYCLRHSPERGMNLIGTLDLSVLLLSFSKVRHERNRESRFVRITFVIL